MSEDERVKTGLKEVVNQDKEQKRREGEEIQEYYHPQARKTLARCANGRGSSATKAKLSFPLQFFPIILVLVPIPWILFPNT